MSFKKEPKKREIMLSKSTMFSVLFAQKVIDQLFEEKPYTMLHATLKFRNLSDHPENTDSEVKVESLLEYCGLLFECQVRFGVCHVRKIEGRYTIDSSTDPGRKWEVVVDLPIAMKFQNENLLSLKYEDGKISPDTLWDEELLSDMRKRFTAIFSKD